MCHSTAQASRYHQRGTCNFKVFLGLAVSCGRRLFLTYNKQLYEAAASNIGSSNRVRLTGPGGNLVPLQCALICETVEARHLRGAAKLLAGTHPQECPVQTVLAELLEAQQRTVLTIEELDPMLRGHVFT